MRQNITQNIPGGWYGNDPGTWGQNYPNQKHGNVIVDPEQLPQALAWLKRRATVTCTRIVDDGIGITYELK